MEGLVALGLDNVHDPAGVLRSPMEGMDVLNNPS